MVNDLLKCRKIVFLYFHILYLHKNIFLPANVPYPQSPLPVVNTLLHNSPSDPYLSGTNSISLCYQCQTGHDLINYCCQTTGHNLKYSINGKPLGTRSQLFYQCQTTGHDLRDYQCQTLGMNTIPTILSMPDSWAQSKLFYQCQTTERDLRVY